MMVRYVKDFEFPSQAGFTGSAGKQPVRGYMRGGQVKSKNTSKEFKQKSGRQDTMDNGTMPPGSANQAEKEAGGRKRTLPGYAKGGKASPPSVGMLGKGAAAEAAKALRSREERMKATLDSTMAQIRQNTSAAPASSPKTKESKPTKPKATKPKAIRETKGTKGERSFSQFGRGGKAKKPC